MTYAWTESTTAIYIGKNDPLSCDWAGSVLEHDRYADHLYVGGRTSARSVDGSIAGHKSNSMIFGFISKMNAVTKNPEYIKIFTNQIMLY